MKAAVIDDLAECREEATNALRRYFHENYAGETPVIEEFKDGEEFLSAFIPGGYDLIFIDQYMSGLSGIETAQRIREADRLAALIFITTSREHAVESFRVRACGYLVKPYTYEDFERTMTLCGIEKIRNARFIQIGDVKILLRDILWCSQDDHYVQIHTQSRSILRFRIAFKRFTALLSPYPQFLTCYKGCIVNMERVEQIDGLDFVIDTGDKVPFSQRDKRKLETMFHSYLFQREREDELL
ncbi:LytTR family DNA-binding domain-containing protein [Faecalicatena sp. AGMB00832]|uniref:LytTR family DNA-binding domain-containing protein n=1 Tax=Faecalicatena faecalis TaxID=2726362 RepID=A0ABS6D0N6_9FIRM|nr:LytTR family DNA-binding domain-containing protein [Faecalicatena faecalis]MBU3874915.1 LytTR family DNA-binding domain-containing protein [Faecalicatena faecalis]